jgi:hypothetical protein
MMLSPKELDDQCQIKMDRWIDIFSEEIREMDPDYKLAIKWFKMLQEGPGGLFTDSSGRIWLHGKDKYYPYHFIYKNQLIGYRISARAAN